jgi:hypothetical protein
MNKTQFEILMEYCKRHNIKTVGELDQFKKRTKAKTNRQLLYRLILTRKVFVK